MLFVSSCRIAQLTDGLVYKCGPNGECEPGRVCTEGFCVVEQVAGDAGFDAGCVATLACAPEDCGVLGIDECGSIVDCGECQVPARCGVLRPNRCDCVRYDAGSQVCPSAVAGAVACGSKVVNNCGTNETFECGPPTCPGGNLCVENICCDPPSDAELCSSAGFECGAGEAIDRCGMRRRLDCGLCPVGRRCEHGDVGSTCLMAACVPESDVEFCDGHGANCGALTAVDRCGLPRTDVRCGDECDAGGCTNPLPNQCTCQGLLAGCAVSAHCCGPLECGTANLCCVPLNGACVDDSDCCGRTHCQQSACCGAAGAPCGGKGDCCSGRCGSDGGCEGVDAGGEWDGGEL